MTDSDPDPKTEAAQPNPTGPTPPSDEVAADIAAAQEDARAARAEKHGVEADLRAAEADIAEARADARSAEADGAAKKRRPIGAVALLALAAALLWVSSRMTWVTLDVVSELGPGRTMHLNGGSWFGALTPLALVLVATIAAVFAARGWWRRGLGVVVAVLAAVAAVPAYALLKGAGKTAERAGRLAELRDWEHVGGTQTSTLPAVLTIIGALAAFGAGVLLTRMPSESAAPMSGKYDNPVFRKSEAAEQVAEHHAVKRAAESGSQQTAAEPLSGRVLWDALDAGADPTDDETNTPAAHDDPGSGGAGHKPA
ncbi:TIGR02234 family membrane protein [Nocardia sp. SYP-A9097]|uniref:TIGR02234 family membrane protein n=1 Tax=Nocardia sp. SYP-A9097 TaxID=2663237 RepID=UPI00129A4539|nr:TIGR02234 family membrane protein [Nocardia sp. SYP-A9097]MRH89975.1 TIGR02234 family membrane protein [Nocardia sp. SYP-A9097]